MGSILNRMTLKALGPGSIVGPTLSLVDRSINDVTLRSPGITLRDTILYDLEMLLE